MTGIQYRKRLDLFNPKVITGNFHFQVRSELINIKLIRLAGFIQVIVKKLLISVTELEKVSDFCKNTECLEQCY